MQMTNRLIRLTAPGIFALCFSGTASAQEMTRFEIISECTQTIQRSAIYRDQPDAERYSNLFVEDGVIVIGSNATEGRDAIAERVRTSDPSELDRHLTGSIVVDIDDSGSITAKSYALIYEGVTPESPGSVRATEYLMADYDDQMVMTDTGCKFVRRQVTMIFSGDS